MNDADRAVLAYVVVDPDAWYEHVEATFGNPEEVLRAKVNRWKAEYQVAASAPGYLPRADRPDDAAAH